MKNPEIGLHFLFFVCTIKKNLKTILVRRCGMKKLISLLISAIVALSLAGCTIVPAEPVEPTEGTKTYAYTDFTDAQKDLLTEHLGEVIPFAPNDYYSFESCAGADNYEEGFRFRTTDSTAEDFLAYQAHFTGYTLSDTYSDDDGHTWYSYTKENLLVEVSYYINGDIGFIDVYARLKEESTPPINRTYIDWTASDKALFTQYIGALIPFLPNDEYYIEGYYDETDYEYGLCLITVGTTKAEFDTYLTAYSSYIDEGSYPDEEDGTPWYCFKKDDVVVDLTYYTEDGVNYVNVFVYSSLSKDPNEDDTTKENVDLITNDGKGLPTDTDGDGVYDVNFKDATNVKDVTDQGFYLGGCPTTGTPAVLVIPIGFRDGNQLTAENIDLLEKAFGEDGSEFYYYSVDNFYKIASYNQLDLDITVLDEWFVPEHDSTYYAGLMDETRNPNGDQVLMNEVLAYLDAQTEIDLSIYDSDQNGAIDSVVLINNLDVDPNDIFYWAYRYWNTYADDEGYYYTYDGVCANDYIWASYYFLHESYQGDDVIYGDMSAFTTYTYIHEFGHVLGADDYYDTSEAENHPMDGCDVMDSMLGDHSAYTKFNFGWLTTSRLVVTDSSVTLTLEDFSKNGDTIIIANNWDSALGAYQEYYIVVYYTRNALNSGDYGYFSRDGIVVYHINASLYREEDEGEIYYDVYNNNTDISHTEGYGTENNLIEFVKSADDNFTYVVGDSLPVTQDDSGNALGYTFVVDALTDDTATITFTKR